MELMEHILEFHITKFLFLTIINLVLFILFVSGSIERINLNSVTIPKLPRFNLPSNYNKDERPAKFGEIVHVQFEIHVQAINPIKASDMDFRMELMMSQRWTDTRLVFPDDFFENTERFVLPIEFIDLIWHPDPFFANAKSTDVGQLTQRLINIYIYKNQTVIYSINLFATIACAMQFQYYPYDFQLCPTVIESFSYDETLVKYSWSPVAPFTIDPKLRLLQFVVTYPLRTEECTIHRDNQARNFSQLVAYFRFDRLLGNHLIQTFSPCCLVVSLTWFSFWLELDAVSARVSLLVTAMLTLVTQFSGLKLDFPPVAYAKAVDLWMAMCLCFVFAALGEFVVVKVIYSLTEDVKATVAKAEENRIIGNEQEVLSTTSNTLPMTSRFSAQAGDRILIRSNHEPSLNEMDTMDDGTKEFDKNQAYISVYKQQDKRSSPKKIAHRISELEIPDLTYHFSNKLGFPLVWTDSKTLKKHVLWRDIDYLSRWLFPVTFCLCLFIYWTFLFIHSRLNSPDHKPVSYCS